MRELTPGCDEISCLPRVTEALKASFIIYVLRAGLELALLLLSIIYLLSIERSPILRCQIRHEVAEGPPVSSPSVIKWGEHEPQTPALRVINNATLMWGSRAIPSPSVISNTTLRPRKSGVRCRSPFLLTPVRWPPRVGRTRDWIRFKYFQCCLSHFATSHPCRNRIPFRSTTAGAWLTANIIKLCGLSLRGVELKAYRARVLRRQSPITLCVQVFTALELFHFIITLKLPPSEPTGGGGGGGGTEGRVTRAVRGEILPGCSEFLVLSGNRFMSIQTTGAVSSFFFSFFTATVKKGAGQRSAPPRLCLSQLLSRSTFPQSH